jgi:CheY-like chemotaxis protein
MSRHAQEIEDYIRDGMARMLWVHAYMIWTTEVDPAPVLSPGTWDENAPDTASSRRASLQAASDLADMFRNTNRLGAHPMAELFTTASAGYGLPRSHATRSTEGDYAYAFGRALAGICLGTTDPEDSVLPLPRDLIVPSFHVDLDDDGQELTWEGRTDNEPRAWERNPRSNSGEEVLLIEDEPGLQRSTTRMIKKIFPGAEVIVSDNADAAIANLQHHQFVHVVSDVDILGDKSGIDVFRWVEQHQPEMVARYTFFTGNSYAEQVHDRVVMKPAGLPEFRAAILGGGQPPAPPMPATVRPRTTTASPRTVASSPAPLTSQQVASAVRGVAPGILEEAGAQGKPRGRYGRHKVFIAAIWRKLQHDPRFHGMPMAEFKRHLLAANREAHLVLARADLVGAMDRQEVAESEIEDRGSTFHFVMDPNAKDAW